MRIFLFTVSICIGIAISFPTDQLNSYNLRSDSSRNESYNSIIDHLLNFFKMIGEKRMKTIFGNIKNGIETELSCVICKLVYKSLRISQISVKHIQYLFSETCSLFHFETNRVCEGLSDRFGYEVHYILTHTNLSSDDICGTIVGPKCMDNPCSHNNNWNLTLLEKPQLTDNNLYMIENSIETVETNPEVKTRILHITDFHLDQLYLKGSSDNCGEPLCCRASSPIHDKTAGLWGDYYSCDSPNNTIVEMLRYINRTLADEYDYLIWTGDNTPHDVWNNSKESIISTSRTLTSLIRYYLANEKLVFPVIGNHDGFPVDQFAPPEIKDPNLSGSWLYEELWNQWKDFIPNEYENTFKNYGYYSRIVSPKYKVIVLNTNYCARMNFWLYYHPIDPAFQLKWLSQQLSDAEKNGQNVHILGHIPIERTQCTPGWVHNYLLIVQRYRNIIVAQLFGHTHFDEIRIMYSKESQPMSVLYLGPSVTTYEGVNPAFRFYSLNDNAIIVDHDTYFLNLTAANIAQNVTSLRLVKEYNAKEVYSLTSLDPQQWNAFYERMETDDDLFQLYYNHYHRHSNAFSSQCVASCKDEILSSIRIFDPLSCP